MSRFDNDGDYTDYNNAYELWQHNLIRALGSKRGQQALQELREALLALPERKLIARALCTVGGDRRPEPLAWTSTDGKQYVSRSAAQEFDALIEEQGYGVCTVGAFAWHKLVKSGLEPAEAFAQLPTLADYDGGDWETTQVGVQHGLARTLASHLAYLNDNVWDVLTAEERWQKCMDWINAQTTEAVSA